MAGVEVDGVRAEFLQQGDQHVTYAWSRFGMAAETTDGIEHLI
ncbi:hypothetical protein ACH4UM_34520 [Streptomyces sp. NPDC020801]